VRYICLSVLLFIVFDSGTALAAGKATCRCRGIRFHRMSTNSCRPCPTKSAERYCLQRVYFDAPNPWPDVYECLLYPDGCGTPDYEEVYYVGPVSGALPQNCSPNANCESARYGQRPIPPHPFILDSKQKAWQTVDEGLTGANLPTDPSNVGYDIIPMRVAQRIDPSIDRDVYMIMVPVPGPNSGDVRYVCLETEPLRDVTRSQNFHVSKTPDSGRQLRIDYSVGGENRVGFVWLKK
jgi:hypothetical protein